MKKFRLLLIVASLLLLVCPFTACTSSDEPCDCEYCVEPTISLTAGEVTENSITFTLTATGADDVYYWVLPQGADASVLEINKATLLDSKVAETLTQEVTVSSLAASSSYTIYALASNFAYDTYAEPLTMTVGVAIPYPVVTVALDEEEVYEDAFLAFVTVENAQKASWLVVPKYTEGVTAAQVFEQGVAIEDSFVGADGAPAEIAIVVEDLVGGTSYDFYAAAENLGKVTLSQVVSVTTLAPEAPVLEVYFDTLMSGTDINSVLGLPGMWITISSSATGDMAQLMLFDFVQSPYSGFLAGDYYALSGSFDAGTIPSAACLLADPGYTQFLVGGNLYAAVGDKGVDEDGNPYGVNIMTTMPDADNNLISFNIPVVDETGKELLLVGQYMGPMGYQIAAAAYPFNLNDWHFTNFTKTVEGNTVTLKSTNNNGDFIMVLQTEGGVIDGAAFTAGEGGNMTGGHISYLEGAPETFAFTSGRISFEKVDDNGNYKLIVSTRGGDWIMQGQSVSYKIEALEYDITITDAQ